MTSANVQYFIVTRKPEFPQHVNPGRLCYTSKCKDNIQSEHKVSNISVKLRVFVFGSNPALAYDIEKSVLEELSEEFADLLLAVQDDAERMKWFRENVALHVAQQLAEGTLVTVEENGEKLRGVIRFAGTLVKPTHPLPLSGRFFGIELQVGCHWLRTLCLYFPTTSVCPCVKLWLIWYVCIER